jgi:type IV fimbrial biogenesis protein FimT
MRTKTASGLTLVELLIVFVIVGILTTIAVPSYQIFMAQRRLNGAARMVMSDLMAARMKAISLNQKVKVSFGSNVYKIWNDFDSNGTVADNEGDNIQKDIHPAYYDIALSTSANPIFDPRGTAALGGTVTLTNSRGSKYVIVALTGRVRISDTSP